MKGFQAQSHINKCSQEKIMNETTKYGLFFLGGVMLGALVTIAVTRGKLDVKPLATDLLSTGIDLKDKAMGLVESAKEDLADAVAEAQVKSQVRRAQAEEAAAKTADVEVAQSQTVETPAEAPVATPERAVPAL